MQDLDSRDVIASASQQGLHSLRDDRAISSHEIRDALRLLSQAMSLEESPKVRKSQKRSSLFHSGPPILICCPQVRIGVMIAWNAGPILVAGMSTGKSPNLVDGHWMLADAEADKQRRSSSQFPRTEFRSSPSSRAGRTTSSQTSASAHESHAAASCGIVTFETGTNSDPSEAWLSPGSDFGCDTYGSPDSDLHWDVSAPTTVTPDTESTSGYHSPAPQPLFGNESHTYLSAGPLYTAGSCASMNFIKAPVIPTYYAYDENEELVNSP